MSVNWVCLFWWVWRWYLAIAIDLMIPNKIEIKRSWKKIHSRESRTCRFDVFDSLSWDKMHKSFQVVIIICIVIVSTCGFLILFLFLVLCACVVSVGAALFLSLSIWSMVFNKWNFIKIEYIVSVLLSFIYVSFHWEMVYSHGWRLLLILMIRFTYFV